MISPDYARLMARYNRWMNGRIYAAAARLSDAERRRDLGAFFKSLHGTLNHILLGDRVWLGRFGGAPFVPRALDQELCADFAELQRERSATDDAIDALAAGLTETRLAGPLTYHGFLNPGAVTVPFALALAHLFNHQTHHRGQATTLLMQLGVDPGVTDLVAMPAGA
jgi:uncharacterized damage-inducible protein DinB